jgi:hypothetical protein
LPDRSKLIAIIFITDPRHSAGCCARLSLYTISSRCFMERFNSLSSRSLQYYTIARQWASDLEFYKFETGFIHRLLDEYFAAILKAGERENMRQILNDLMRLEVENNQLERALAEQLKHLELMSEDVIPEDVSWLAGKQIRLEYMVAGIFGEYKELKRKIFAVMEKVLAQDRAAEICFNFN